MGTIAKHAYLLTVHDRDFAGCIHASIAVDGLRPPASIRTILKPEGYSHRLGESLLVLPLVDIQTNATPIQTRCRLVNAGCWISNSIGGPANDPEEPELFGGKVLDSAWSSFCRHRDRRLERNRKMCLRGNSVRDDRQTNAFDL